LFLQRFTPLLLLVCQHRSTIDAKLPTKTRELVDPGNRNHIPKHPRHTPRNRQRFVRLCIEKIMSIRMQ